MTKAIIINGDFTNMILVEPEHLLDTIQELIQTNVFMPITDEIEIVNAIPPTPSNKPSYKP